MIVFLALVVTLGLLGLRSRYLLRFSGRFKLCVLKQDLCVSLRCLFLFGWLWIICGSFLKLS